MNLFLKSKFGKLVTKSLIRCKSNHVSQRLSDSKPRGKRLLRFWLFSATGVYPTQTSLIFKKFPDLRRRTSRPRSFSTSHSFRGHFNSIREIPRSYIYTIAIMADATLKEVPLNSVQVEALVRTACSSQGFLEADIVYRRS
jgi:hypothetical protein